MALVVDIMDWVPGALKLSTGAAVPETSIVFPESVIHPAISSPGITVSVDEEEMLIFMHSLLQQLYKTLETTADADVPTGFTVRRTFALETSADQAIVRWSVDIPVETPLVFGRRSQ